MLTESGDVAKVVFLLLWSLRPHMLDVVGGGRLKVSSWAFGELGSR